MSGILCEVRTVVYEDVALLAWCEAFAMSTPAALPLVLVDPHLMWVDRTATEIVKAICETAAS